MANQPKTTSSQPKPGMAPKLKGGAASGVGKLQLSRLMAKKGK